MEFLSFGIQINHRMKFKNLLIGLTIAVFAGALAYFTYNPAKGEASVVLEATVRKGPF
jgi:hypothetical protein